MKNILINENNGNDIWKKAGERLAQEIQESVNKGNRTLVLLSGGSATNIYKYIILQKFLLPTSNFQLPDILAFAQIDERFQPENKDDVNAHEIGKTGLWEECNKYGIPYYLVSQEGSLEKSATDYDDTIRKLFSEYDHKIAILGIGADGHTAGLLPGYGKYWNPNSSKSSVSFFSDTHRFPMTQNLRAKYPLDFNSDIKAFSSVSKKDTSGFAVVGYKNKGKFPQRITLTPYALKQMDYALVIAVGKEKQEIINRLLDSSFRLPVKGHFIDTTNNSELPIANSQLLNKFPALILREMKKVEIFTDNFYKNPEVPS